MKAWNEILTSRLAVLPENLPAVNWACYEASVTKAGVVDDYEKFKTLKVPMPENKYTVWVDAEERKT